MNSISAIGTTLSISYILDARADTPHFPGIGRYVRNLSAALSGRLAEHESLVLLQGPDSGETSPTAGIRTAPPKATPFSLAQQWQIPPLLRGHHVYHSPYYLMPYRPGIPTVLTVYDLIPRLFPDHVSPQARLVFRLATRFAVRTADRIICISEATRQDLLKHFPQLDPLTVTAIPLAPAPQFRPQPPEKIDAVRKKYQLPNDFTLYLGINKPHKNLARLVETWPHVRTGMPLVIAGAWDPRYEQLRSRATESARIRFLGRIPESDLPALYTACRLFVFPSLYEGFGLPVVEALACGAAVACSNTSSLPEVGGEAVTYFDPENPNSIRQALEDALQAAPNPERSLGQAGRFSWAHTAEATLALYRRLVDG